MPILSDKVKYTELTLKPPLTLRMQIPKYILQGARGKLGTTVGGAMVNRVAWEAVIKVCKEGEADCATPVNALSVAVHGSRAESVWKVKVTFQEFYLSKPAVFTADLFRFGAEQDVNIDIQFTDSLVNITANGKPVVTTDMFKKFEQVREIEANNAFYSDGAEVSGVADDLLVYVLNVIHVPNLVAVVTNIVPLVAAFGIVGAVIKLLPQALKR